MMRRRSPKLTDPRTTRGRPAGQGRSKRRTARDPRFYLKAVVGFGGLGLIVLPFAADMTLALARPAASEDGSCRVISVTDGDTVRLFCTSGGLVDARLLGFDTPELFSPNCASELSAAYAAKWGLRQAIWSADSVKIARQGLDRYGRTLTRVWVDDEDLAQVMIAAGHARPYGGGERRSWCTGEAG